MFRDKGFDVKGQDPLLGKGVYINKRTGRRFHYDGNHGSGKPPHIGLYPTGKNSNYNAKDIPLK